jgi:hypothetical protein
MKKLITLSVAVCVVALASALQAGEKSGLQPGEQIGAYNVEKICGNANDGVKDGATLCYRCKLGNRPVVAVFTRSADPKVAKLLAEIDKVVAANEDKKAAAFVNILGSDVSALKKGAQSLVETSKAENIAVVVPQDNDKGPSNLKLNPKVDVTVLIYNKGTIEANHAVSAADLNEKTIKAIVADTGKILK